jgi:transposase-like protein
VNQYPAERKEAILRQMMPPQNRPVSALARENGISEQTLYTWRRNLKSQGVPVPGNGKNAVVWSSTDKFGVVLETARMNEAELAEYCRGKGLFVEQVADWPMRRLLSATANCASKAKATAKKSSN